MKKSIEKEIEEKVGKKLSNEIKKDVEERVEKEVKVVEKKLEKENEKKVEKQIEEVKKQVEKKFKIKLYETTKSSAYAFKEELKKHTATAITAAFAFLIALSWRSPIQKSVENLIEFWGLKGGEIYLDFMAAIIITVIAVLVIMWVSKWTAEKK